MRRALKALAVFGLVITAMSGVLVGVLNSKVGAINTIDTDGLLTNRPTPPPSAEAGNPINVLVIGSDTREGQGSGYGGKSFLGSQRSDTVILVHLSGDRKWASAVSIPRDTATDMPDCLLEDGKVSKGWHDTFNVNFSRGGATCTVTAVEKITGLYIDHFIVVDFLGFRKVVNALGGVQVCLTESVNDKKSHLKLPAGWSTLDGKTALAFFRARKTLGDGSDISRIRRQQDLMASIAKQVISAETLLNPLRLNDLLDAVTQNLTTDSGLGSTTALFDLAVNLSDLDLSNIRFITAPNKYDPSNPNHVIFTEKAAELWSSLRADQQWPKPADKGFDGKVLTKSPEDIKIRVANATDTEGLAAKKAALFEDLGYSIEKIRNASERLGEKTVVYYAADKKAEARTVAKALGLSKNQVKPMLEGIKDVKVIVVVGSDWQDPVEVKVKPAGDTSLYGPSDGRAADETTCSPA